MDETGATFYDQWGNLYRIRTDLDGDGRVPDPSGSGEIEETLLVWSAGPDGDFDTWEDNIKTWETD